VDEPSSSGSQPTIEDGHHVDSSEFQ